jgi:hypothetical protein
MRCAISGVTAKSVPWANIFWMSVTSDLTPTATQMNAFAQAFYGVYATDFWSLLGNDATLQRCVCNYYSTAGAQYVGEYLHDTAGGSDNATEVDSLACVVSWTIPRTWRGGKPRTYLGCLPTEAIADSNSLDADFVTAVESAAASFKTGTAAISAGGFSGGAIACMSFFSGNAPRVPPIVILISGSTVHPRIDSMRRRLGREFT